MRRRFSATAVYLAYSAGIGFFFPLLTVVYSVFAIVRLGLSPLQLLLLGTTLEGTYLLAEIPTGVLADTIGRRVSVIVGVGGTGLAFIVLGAAHSFLVAAIAQAMFGVSAALESGADVAWITDEIGEEAARPLYLRAGQIGIVSALAGIGVSVALASIDLRLPIVSSGAGHLLVAIGLLLFMPEEGFRRPERGKGRHLGQELVATLKDGVKEVRAHHVLGLILVTAALHGASTEGFDRLSDLHILKDIGLPAIGSLNRVVWFGILDAVALLLGLGALSVVKRRRLEGHAAIARALMGVDGLLVISVVAFGLLGSFWPAVLALWLAGAMRSVREPIFHSWINQGLNPGTRATINSMGAQADAVGQSVGGPALGVTANRSVPAALVISGLLRLPAVLLCMRAIRRGTVGTLAPEEMDKELRIEE